jgi:hypothetical protein
LGFAVVAFGLGALTGALKRDGSAIKRASEAAALAFVGGFLARTTISVLLAAADDSRAAGTAIGWGFFLIPGIVDLFARIGGTNALTAPNELLWIAAFVGASTGMMDGIWRIHRADFPGILAFPLDVMWGLAGSTIGCILHLINFAWGDHQEDVRDGGRPGVHRYASGFRLKGEYAFTQGSVMSNLKYTPSGDKLWWHEYTHSWQNRIFGPLFVTTYLAWMGLMLIPGMIAAAVEKRGVGGGIQGYTYYSNPWEAWAYKVQELDRTKFDDEGIVLRDGTVIALTVPYVALVAASTIGIVAAVWF